MNDFDAGRFFDFENADDFLESISGSINSNNNSVNNNNNNNNNGNPSAFLMDQSISGGLLAPATTTNNNNAFPSALVGDEPLNRYYSNNSDNTSIEWSDSNNNNIINNALSDLRSLSTTSYSQDDGITPPNVNSSISSVHTSPEPTKVKVESTTSEEEYDYSESDDQKSLTKSSSKKNSKKSSKVTKPKAKDKSSHNMIEKKYRTNINSKILTLRDAVPSLRITVGKGDISISDLEGLTPASKLNKASVLTKATEYIKHLEGKNEILLQQNLQLQRLIQDANLRPQQQQHQQQQLPPPPQHQPSQQQQQQPQPQLGFYAPNDQSFYAATPLQPSYSSSNGFIFTGTQQQFSPPPPQQQQQQPNKFLLGGMATVMGTSLFAGTGANDFKGLSALPFAHLLPYALTHPSPIVLQLWSLFKVLLFMGSLASLIIPMINKSAKKGENQKVQVENDQQNLIVSWFLISFGFQLPIELSDQQRDQILYRLIHGSSYGQLIQDYLLLSISQINFENCLLNLIIGKFLILKYPRLETLLNRNLSIKGSLILNLDYKGSNKSIQKLNQLIKNFDGLSILGSETLILRLINLINGEQINFEIFDGQNHVKYVEIFQDNINNYYGIIFNWRILEIIHQLNLNYLYDVIDEENNDNNQQEILQDLIKIEQILSKEDGRIYHYFKLFKTILNANDCPYLLKDLNEQVEKYLTNFRVMMEGQELTDHEIFDDEEGDNEEEENQETEETDADQPVKIKFKPSLKSQKSLITSLNLVNEEQFIILTSSLVLYYYNNNEVSKAIKLLNYLKLSSNDNKLTCLSFTSIISLLQSLIPGKIEDNDILDNLIKLSREWLNETKFMEFELRSDVSKFIIDKAIILNGIESNLSDNE
ncbi:bHLH DNA-binding protein that promotes hyphal development [Scheffersomyces coipomensis]|uniref:bHLH DNA-binding protein that promotes hyphal development n=1 Tax=Scheffersomyces coipomensis TaxID=1788519 RepID=UPI00315D7450